MLVTLRKELYTSNTNCLLIKGHPNYWYKSCEYAMYTQQTTVRKPLLFLLVFPIFSTLIFGVDTK